MRPFNLEQAKQGKPIIDRKGQSYKFVAYVPDAVRDSQVVLLDKNGDINIRNIYGAGAFNPDYDLFMAPEKVTLRMYKSGTRVIAVPTNETVGAPYYFIKEIEVEV